MSARILVTGSLAFDHIMDFPGRFADHILPDKIHNLNVSFSVDTLKKQWGGTAGNIAYNLGLLGERSEILACAGADFSGYKKHLEKFKVATGSIKIIKNDLTPISFVMTDRADNQIAGFYGRVMGKSKNLTLRKFRTVPNLTIISPNDPLAMIKFAKECRKLKVPYIFDPGQQIPRLSPTDIIYCIGGADVVIGNDYEIELICRKIKSTIIRLVTESKVVIVTKGGQGSVIYTKKELFTVPAVKAKKIVDPTGAGDAYRAGLIKGMVNYLSWEESGRLASLSAVYAVEKYGTQEHFYTPPEFKKRYEKSFGEFPEIDL